MPKHFLRVFTLVLSFIMLPPGLSLAARTYLSDCDVWFDDDDRRLTFGGNCSKSTAEPPDPSPSPISPPASSGPNPPHLATPDRLYYVRPDGDDTGPCTEDEPCASFTFFNKNATAGDTLIIGSGYYSGPENVIKPENSGNKNAWIVYRAQGNNEGDGKVYLPVDGHDATRESGAVLLYGKQYIEIDGGKEQRIVAEPAGNVKRTERAGVVFNLWGAANIKMHGVVGRCPTPEKSCLYIVTFGAHYQSVVPTHHILISNSTFEGSSTEIDTDGLPAGPSSRVEDAIMMAGPDHIFLKNITVTGPNGQGGCAHHVCIDIINAASDIVIRDSVIDNQAHHTAISCWTGGKRLWLDGNLISSTGRLDAAPSAGPGNAVQLGCSEALLSYNHIRYGGDRADVNTAVGGVICASGYDQELTQAYTCRNTLVVGNVIEDSFYTAWGTLDFGISDAIQATLSHVPKPAGNNTLTSNLFMGGDDTRIVYWDPQQPTGDRWKNNELYGFDLAPPHLLTGQGIDDRGGNHESFVRVLPADFIAQARREAPVKYRKRGAWPRWMGLGRKTGQ